LYIRVLLSGPGCLQPKIAKLPMLILATAAKRKIEIYLSLKLLCYGKNTLPVAV
jgi:hypothetical protein